MSEVHAQQRDHVLVLTINRPEAHNALNGNVIAALRSAVVAAADNSDILAVVITGAGNKAFSAGADLKELHGLGADEAAAILGMGQQAFRDIEKAEIPVIAAVNGIALGGGFELILASTFPVLQKNARMGLPESSLGLIPGYGGTHRLSKIVGENVAMHLMLTGTKISAERGYELGLSPVPPVEQGHVLETALEIAGVIAKQGPAAVKKILRSVDRGRGVTTDVALQIETGLAALSVAGEESTEGIEAFISKRPANFGPTNSGKGNSE